MKPALSAALLALVAAPVLLSTASAQAQSYGGRTWGQPYYGAYSRPSPLSEAEPESHARLGAAGTGYTYGGGPVVYRGYGHADRYRGRSHGRSYAYGYGYGRYNRPSQPGYRDEWGYNDDRPPSRWRSGLARHSHDHDYRNCGCSYVYLYDR